MPGNNDALVQIKISGEPKVQKGLIKNIALTRLLLEPTMAIETSPLKAARRFICPHCNASYHATIVRQGLILGSADQGICRDINAVVFMSAKEGALMVDTNEKPFRCPHCDSAFGRFVYL